MERIMLITGFEPFGGAKTNASWEAVRRLPDRDGEWVIHPLLLPVEYIAAGRMALAAAEALKPAAIICTGVAGSRDAITPERIAVNWRAAALCDNAGRIARGEVIDPAGPDGIFTRLPAEDMAEALRAMGLPAAVSFTAGTFVCNDVFYQVMARYATSGMPCGFIHLPPEDRLPPERCAEGLLACIRVAARAVPAPQSSE